MVRGLLGSTREEVSGSEFLCGGDIREEVDVATVESDFGAQGGGGPSVEIKAA